MQKLMSAFENGLQLYLKNMLGNCEVEDRADNCLRFVYELEKGSFVLMLLAYTGEFNYVTLTNILLPNSIKRKGVSVEIISEMLKICNSFGYVLFVTGFANDGFKDGLIRHGAQEDNDGDVFINSTLWQRLNPRKDFKFIEFEDELVLENELEQYKQKKEEAIAGVKSFFESKGASAEIRMKNGYIERIVSDYGRCGKWVVFNYLTVKYVMELISKDDFDRYFQENQYIGGMF